MSFEEFFFGLNKRLTEVLNQGRILSVHLLLSIKILFLKCPVSLRKSLSLQNEAFILEQRNKRIKLNYIIILKVFVLMMQTVIGAKFWQHSEFG